MDAMTRCYPAHTENEVSSCVGQNMALKCVLALRKLCVLIGIDCGFPVASQYLMVLEAQGGAVLGMAWPLPSGSASSPLRILNEHFRL